MNKTDLEIMRQHFREQDGSNNLELSVILERKSYLSGRIYMVDRSHGLINLWQK